MLSDAAWTGPPSSKVTVGGNSSCASLTGDATALSCVRPSASVHSCMGPTLTG